MYTTKEDTELEAFPEFPVGPELLVAALAPVLPLPVLWIEDPVAMAPESTVVPL